MKICKVLCFTFLAMLTACNRVPSLEPEMVFEESDEVKASEIVHDYSLIPLELTEENQILDATEIKIIQNKIFVLDCFSPTNKTLHVFGMDGKYLGHVGNTGQGPGEYIMPQYFMVNEAEQLIYIRDIAMNKLLSYNLDSFEFVNEYPLSFYSTCCELVNQNRIVWYVNSGLKNEGDMLKHIQVSDMQGTVQKSFVEPQDFPQRGLYNILNCFTQYGDQVFFHHPFLNEYFEVTDEGVSTAFTLNFDHHQFPTSAYLAENKEKITDRLKEDGLIQYCDALMSDRKVACFFGIDKTIYWGVYDRKAKKGVYIDRSKIIDDLGIGVLGRPKTVFNNQFVTAVSTEDLDELPETSILQKLGKETVKNSNLLLLLFN